MTVRGGVQARNYVLHIPRGEKTVCGRRASNVNCFSDKTPSKCAIEESCCKLCAKHVLKFRGSCYEWE
jgi:hypothetical protein